MINTIKMTETSGQDSSIEKTWTPPQPAATISSHMLGRISELMIMDSQCCLLVHKRSLQNITYRKAQQVFAKHMKTVGQNSLSPYFREENIDFFYLSKNDVYLVAAQISPETDTAICAVVYLDFLNRLYEILKECIGMVNEPYIAVNKMLVFEVLDEVLSFGYGLISSYSEIKSQLVCEPIRPKILQQDDLASRFFGINTTEIIKPHSSSSQQKQKYPDSVYLNIVEGLSAVLGPHGEVYSSELWGKLTLINTLRQLSPIVVQLSPDLLIRTAGSAQGQVAGATQIENPSFHPCLDISQLTKNKLLKIFPPPGQTRLMIYTLSDSACINIPLLVIPTLVPVDGSRDQNLSLRLINQAHSAATATNVRVRTQLPQCVSSVSTTRFGELELQSSRFIASEKVAEWEVKRSPGATEALITFRLIINTDKDPGLEDIGPISVSFNITNFSASGLMVTVATIAASHSQDSTSPASQCYFGVSTKAVSYTIRTDYPKEQSYS